MTDKTDSVRPDPIPRVTRDDPAAHSGDVVADNIAALKSLFPAIVTDGRVDFDVLRQLLGDAVEEGAERYGLNWHGKARARAFAMTPSLGTLRPARADSKDWDTTRNIVVEGDNLEVLKLLRKSYAGKVKLIYIDPPYNTGKDFVYPDNYTDSLANYEALTDQRGADGARLTSNKEASGRFHTDWLNMMYPRLMLAKEFLRDDGVIFISIDEKEYANLSALCNDIFGESNIVGTIAWKASTDNNPTRIAIEHELIVCYALDASILEATWKNKTEDAKVSLLAEYDRLVADFNLSTLDLQREIRTFIRRHRDILGSLTHYDRVDENGLYTGSRKVHNPKPGGYRYDVLHPETKKPCVLPLNGYRYPKATMERLVVENRIIFGTDESNIVQIKEYLHDYEGKLSSVLVLDSRSGANELDSLMGVQKLFTNPKPVQLLTSLFDFVLKPDDIILDFFAGSGTTGHAVMAQNAADGGDRRYILVQLPEPLDPAKAEQKTAADFCDRLGRPRTIAELTKERLRRAGDKVRADHPTATLDTGFRVYKLATSNLKPWQPGPDLARDLLDAADNVMPGRDEEDLLVELLLKTGIDLTLQSETRTVTQRTVHAFGGGALIVCLSDIPAHAAPALGDGIADWLDLLDPPGKTTFFFRDSAFDAGSESGGDHAAEAKANLAATLRQRRGDARIEKLGAI